MTQRERIARFERLGLGLFVHFGVFSVPEGGEWHQAASKESAAEYARYLDRFFRRRTGRRTLRPFHQEIFQTENLQKSRARFMPGPVFHDTITERTM